MAPRYPTATYEQLMTAQIPQDVAEMLRQEERALYQNAFESNANPAENIYRMAQMRGYRPAPPANAAAAAVTNGAAAPALAARPGTPLAAAPSPGTPSAADVVASIQNGQKAAMSLSNASGSNAGIDLTPQALAEMSEEKFADIVNQLQNSGNRTELMRLFGS